ncbi:hypothetical protein [Roseibium sp. M-1]
MKPYLPALSLLLIALATSIGMLVTKNAGEKDMLSVAVFPPWWSEKQSFGTIAGTGASIAAPGPYGWMVVVVPQSESAAAHLKSASGLILMNANFARLCGADQSHASLSEAKSRS